MRTEYLAIALFTASALYGQSSCPTQAPEAMYVSASCGAQCLAGTPVSLMLNPIVPDCAGPPCNVHPYQLQACDTVTWDFGDGTTATTTGGGFIQHIYAAGGNYQATATITNSLGSAPAFSNPIAVGANPPVYVELANATLTVPETAGAMTFNLVRSGDFSHATIVHYVQPPPGTPPSARVETASADVTFAPGETAKSFSLQVHDDHVYSGNLNGAVLLTSSDGTLFRSNGQTGSSAGAGFTITEDDPQPTASIADGRALEAVAAQKYAELVVTMSAPMGVPVQFLGDVEDGTAKAGTDYVRGSTTCIIDAGQTSCALHVLIIDDDVPEPDETFTLTAEQRAGEPGPSFTRKTATFTIVNDDAALTPSTSRVSPGAPVALRLDVGQAQPSPLVVPLQSSSPEVVDVPPSVTIPAGQSSAGFTAHAIAAGRSRVTAAVPNMTAPPATVNVVDPVTIVAQPAALALRPGSDAAVAVSLEPPRNGPQFMSAASTRPDVATVPDTLTIPAGGTAALPVHAVAIGVATISISTPDGFSFSIDVVVSNDPTVARIEPAGAPATGGTAVMVIGEGLDARCSIAFGATPATAVSAAANGLAVVVPAHAPGVVDVSVVCGASKVTLPNAFTFFVPRRRAAG